MWFMAVYSKAWLLLWNTGSSLSLWEEDSSLRSGSTRLAQLLHGMGSISHRFTMPTDHWRTDLMPDGMVERMSPWAKDQAELTFGTVLLVPLILDLRRSLEAPV